ncbi:O-Antigen ligase [Gaiella occulta]|uniref:O-Antigen ligase n=1 Tax=Gaiella occulta TaxID=1002870 RepID=A0A7M2Z186_9ACTN|nr:O-antigen ligase family protein [Gaiella occulta]RDI76051.1 O-Antigen ligase [Gaiella occulta]
MDAAPEGAVERGSGRSGWAGRLVLAVAAALLAWAVLAGGGSGSDALPWLGSAAVLAAAAALAAVAQGVLPAPRLPPAGTAAVAAACALVAWSGASIAWSIAGDRSWEALDKGLVYGAFAVLGLVLSGLGARSIRGVAAVLAAVIGAALVWSLLGKAVPALGPDDAGRVARLHGPVAYWNALALLAGAAIALGLWLAAAVRGRLGRPAGMLLVYLAAIALLLTQSRAGLVGAVAVTGLWLALSAERVEGALLALLAAAPGLAVGAWAFTRPALVEDGAARAQRVSDGALLAALVLAGAVIVLALGLRAPVERLVAARRAAVVRALAGGAAVIAAAGAIGLVAAVGNPFTWAVDQIGAQGEVPNDPSRFGDLSTNDRLTWWGEAWQVFRAHPARGTGAYTFELARRRYRDDARNVSEPHSVPLQMLSDTGVPGLALLVLLAAALAVGLRSTLARLHGGERAAAAALVALPAAYGVHALVDYDLDFVAVSAPTALVAAALLGAGLPARRLRANMLAGAGVLAAGLAAVYALVAPALAARNVDTAYRDAEAGRLAAAAAAARRAQGLNPLSPEPLWARADVADAAGDDAAAERFYEQAARLQPENPATWYRLGLYRQLARGDQCGAYQALNAGYTLDPKSTLWAAGGPLDVARAAVDDPKHPACGRG